MTDQIKAEEETRFESKHALGSFQKLNESQQDAVMEVVAQYHYRNGNKQSDGSLGNISITRNEFNDLIAYILAGGYMADHGGCVNAYYSGKDKRNARNH